MGHNSTKFDKEAHYAAKTTRELEDLVVFWKNAIVKFDNRMHQGHVIAIEELGLVQMKLAERIGKKGVI